MKFLILFLLSISCVEDQAERIKRLEGLQSEDLKNIQTSYENYESLRAKNNHIDFSVQNTEVISTYEENSVSFEDVREETTTFFTNKSGEVIGRNYVRYRRKYELSEEGKRTEITSESNLESKYSETEFNGGLGENSEGMRILTLKEIYENCEELIRSYTIQNDYNVTLNFESDNGLLTDCYYTRSGDSESAFKSGISGLNIMVK